MPRRTNQQIRDDDIREKMENALTVGDLITGLQQIDPDTLVGRVGHFGEAHLMLKHTFTVTQSYIVPFGGTWRNPDDHVQVTILDMETPDIGPDPD